MHACIHMHIAYIHIRVELFLVLFCRKSFRAFWFRVGLCVYGLGTRASRLGFLEGIYRGSFKGSRRVPLRDL